MQENRQHTHKNCDTRYTLGNPHREKKPCLQKHPSPCIIQQKIPFPYNHGSLHGHSHNQANYVNKHESTHPMPCFQPSQMLPWLTCQALFHLTLAFCLLLVTLYNNYPCGCLYSSKSHKTTKWYYINHVLPNPLTPHLILGI